MKLLLYCTKTKPYLTMETDFVSFKKFHCYDIDFGCLNGKIVAECDFEVEKITYKNNCYYFDYSTAYYILRKSCLSCCEIDNYLKYQNGYAIHIKNLHIFDEPKELVDYSRRLPNGDFQALGKAPYNMMKCCEIKYMIEDYILISIRPQWLCKILNGEKTIEVRKKVLKEMCYENKELHSEVLKMNRYTEEYDVIVSIDKDGNEVHSKGIQVKDRDLADKKLFEIENIEEKLGIDLLLYFKLFELKEKNKPIFIFHHHKNKICEVYVSSIYTIEKYISVFSFELGSLSYSFEEYGRTWALTKEVLNDNS